MTIGCIFSRKIRAEAYAAACGVTFSDLESSQRGDPAPKPAEFVQRGNGKHLLLGLDAERPPLGQFTAKTCTKNTVGLSIHAETVPIRFSVTIFGRWTNSAGLRLQAP